MPQNPEKLNYDKKTETRSKNKNGNSEQCFINKEKLIMIEKLCKLNRRLKTWKNLIMVQKQGKLNHGLKTWKN